VNARSPPISRIQSASPLPAQQTLSIAVILTAAKDLRFRTKAG